MRQKRKFRIQLRIWARCLICRSPPTNVDAKMPNHWMLLHRSGWIVSPASLYLPKKFLKIKMSPHNGWSRLTRRWAVFRPLCIARQKSGPAKYAEFLTRWNGAESFDDCLENLQGKTVNRPFGQRRGA